MVIYGNPKMNIPAAVFKAECLKLMDEVARTGKAIVVTKHGKPVAQLVPIAPQAKSLFGYMKNSLRIKGDIVSPRGESWSADTGEEDHLISAAAKKSASKRAKFRK
jgi:prevent-host-death family protein